MKSAPEQPMQCQMHCRSTARGSVRVRARVKLSRRLHEAGFTQNAPQGVYKHNLEHNWACSQKKVGIVAIHMRCPSHADYTGQTSQVPVLAATVT